MKRREFIGLAGGAATAWPFGARAQQPAMPVIGFLFTGSSERSDNLPAFHQGLAKTGNIEGRNFAIEYRWAGGQTEPLAALAAELVGRRVTVIVTVNTTNFYLIINLKAAKALGLIIPPTLLARVDEVIE
jgi:putative ABC transport system substrate-binding protein